MAADNDSLEQDFQALDAIESPDPQAHRFNGRPVLNIPKDMFAEAEREGYIPPEKRGPPPFTADHFLMDNPGEYDDDVFIPTDEEEAEIQRHLNGEAAPLGGRPSEKPEVDEPADISVADHRPDDDNSESDSATEPKAKGAGGQSKNMAGGGRAPTQVGPGGMLVSGLGGAGRTLINGVARLGMLGATGAASAGLYSAKGARWGWEANRRQRHSAYARWAAATTAKAEGLPERIDSTISELKGSDLMEMAQKRADLQALDSPTSLDRKQINALGDMMKTEIANDPHLRSTMKRLDGTFRDAREVLQNSERHMRRSALDQDGLENQVKGNVEAATEKAKRAFKGMVDQNGEDMSERIRKLTERLREFIKNVVSFFSGTKSQQSMG